MVDCIMNNGTQSSSLYHDDARRTSCRSSALLPGKSRIEVRHADVVNPSLRQENGVVRGSHASSAEHRRSEMMKLYWKAFDCQQPVLSNESGCLILLFVIART